MVWNFLNRANNLYCCLDIGTEAVKALIFSMEKIGKDNRGLIVGWGLSYFDKFDIFGTSNFNEQILEKAINEAFYRAKLNSCFCSADRKIKNAVVEQKKWKVLIALSPTILKARVENISFRRENKKVKINGDEERKIRAEIFQKAKAGLEKSFFAENGILGTDMHWCSCDIINFKVDGYNVLKINGYKGEDLSFKILTTFLPQHYYNTICKIVSGLDMEILGFQHIAEGIKSLPLESIDDGFYIDIGGDATQIIGVLDSKLEKISEFEQGVSSFSENISQLIGVDKHSAYNMVEDYCNNNLSEKTKFRLKKIFEDSKLNWYKNFKNELKKMSDKRMFPAVFRFFGGGALVPEIIEVLQQKGGSDFKNILAIDYLDIKKFGIDNLEVLENKANDFNNLQFMTSLLICYNFIKKQNFKDE